MDKKFVLFAVCLLLFFLPKSVIVPINAVQAGLMPVNGTNNLDLSTNTIAPSGSTFTFVTLGDAQDDGTVLHATANQAYALNPNFGIFNGDLESDGVTQAMLDKEISALGRLYPKMLFVRGNHDDHVSGSAGLWENYFAKANRPLPVGVTNFIALDSNLTYLNYSFDYGNSRFVGLDVPGDADLLTTPELNFLDARLTDAENIGLVHAFIFFHGPPYCAESTHCTCSTKNDSSCSPSAFISMINKHPIVDATFGGHEHLLAWTHMDNNRVPSLTHPYEQFLTSPSGTQTNNGLLFLDRVDYADTQDGMAFGAVLVNGSSFTVNFYRVGRTTPVWSKTFKKNEVPSPAAILPRTNTFAPNATDLLVYPYLGNITTSSAVISWAMDTVSAGTGQVTYSQDQTYGNLVGATSQTIDGRVWYSAQITGLTANTTYYYKILNNAIDITPWPTITFSTSPDLSMTHFDFSVIGDNQPDSAGATPYPATLAIAALMKQQNPNLVIHTGDMIFDGFLCTGNLSAYSQYVRNYFNVYQAMLGYTSFFTAIGNHEVQTGGCGLQAYKDVYSLPGNAPNDHTEEYYSFNWGNVHFVALDSNTDIKYDTTQRNWLTSDLQNTYQPWKIVFLHVPSYSSGESGSDPDVQAYLVPIFETYGVNVVFNGHDHDYERTCPIRNGVCTTTQNGGVVYFTNGGGGAYTQAIHNPNWFTAYTPPHETNEFLDVSINDCHLQVNAVDINGNLMDSYEINHCSTPTPTLTPTPTMTATITPTPSTTLSPTTTGTSTTTGTKTITPTTTETPTVTNTSSPTTTKTATLTGTATLTPSVTGTPTNTVTYTITPTSTVTRTITPTGTETLTSTSTKTSTSTITRTITPTVTDTITPTGTNTLTMTNTPTSTRTNTSTPSQTKTLTATMTNTSTPPVTDTPTHTVTYTLTPTFTDTLKATASSTPTRTSTNTPSPISTSTVTPTPTLTRTPSVMRFIYMPIFFK
jgi:predicted phosphodiesterase